MTAGAKQRDRGLLRAPQENRATLIYPPWEETAALVDENVHLRSRYDYDFQGRRLADLSLQARRQLLDEARRLTASYRDVDASSADPQRPIFLAGHQPQMFHPGVWAKNFALGRLARRHGATAVNLLIDTDLAKDTTLRVPGGTVACPRIESIPFDRSQQSIPYERRRIADRRLFADFGRRVARQIAELVPDPLIETYWPLAVGRMQQTDNLGACLAQARHQLEAEWGLETLEIPQSRVCSSEPFCWFAAHILAQLPRFRQVYNESVREYRRARRIRTSAHPVPDLAEEDGWLEAPLWISREEDPRRRRLFAKPGRSETVISDRGTLEIALPLQADGDASAAVQRLVELGRQGVKIRSRALITTLWARLVLGDVFLHGIGGAKYDRVTDRLIERFFGLRPPALMVFSGTLHLPIQRPEVTARQARSIGRELRRLTYHPELYIKAAGERPSGVSEYPGTLIAEKNRWIETPQTPQNARTRCRAIRRINEKLQPWVEVRRSELEQAGRQTRDALRAAKLLAWREYAFCLYPEKTLGEFLAGLLPKTA